MQQAEEKPRAKGPPGVPASTTTKGTDAMYAMSQASTTQAPAERVAGLEQADARIALADERRAARSTPPVRVREVRPDFDPIHWIACRGVVVFAVVAVLFLLVHAA
jgi:hypothetical protein